MTRWGGSRGRGVEKADWTGVELSFSLEICYLCHSRQYTVGVQQGSQTRGSVSLEKARCLFLNVSEEETLWWLTFKKQVYLKPHDLGYVTEDILTQILRWWWVGERNLGVFSTLSLRFFPWDPKELGASPRLPPDFRSPLLSPWTWLRNNCILSLIPWHKIYVNKTALRPYPLRFQWEGFRWSCGRGRRLRSSRSYFAT